MDTLLSERVFRGEHAEKRMQLANDRLLECRLIRCKLLAKLLSGVRYQTVFIEYCSLNSVQRLAFSG